MELDPIIDSPAIRALAEIIAKAWAKFGEQDRKILDLLFYNKMPETAVNLRYDALKFKPRGAVVDKRAFLKGIRSYLSRFGHRDAIDAIPDLFSGVTYFEVVDLRRFPYSALYERRCYRILLTLEDPAVEADIRAYLADALPAIRSLHVQLADPYGGTFGDEDLSLGGFGAPDYAATAQAVDALPLTGFGSNDLGAADFGISGV